MAAILVGPPEIYQHQSPSVASAVAVTAADVTAAAAAAPVVPPEIYPQQSPSATATATATGVPYVGVGGVVLDFKKALISNLPHPPPAPKPASVPKPTPASEPKPTPSSPPSMLWTPMGLTENRSPTFLSTGDPCLDFFFHIVPNTPPENLTKRLCLAWAHDALKALKLVCNLRGVRGTGKSDKEGFYAAALWLHENHPKTLAANVAAFADFGYLKDLLEILFRILEGPDARAKARALGESWKEWKSAKTALQKVNTSLTQEKKLSAAMNKKERRFFCMTAKLFRERKCLKRQLVESRKNVLEASSQSREEKRLKMAEKVVRRFNEDDKFKLLHDRISDLFAEMLRSDVEKLKFGDLRKISLAAKWCPSLDSSFDRITLLCETIAKKVFPREEFPEYEGVEEAHYAYRVRDRLRKEVLVPLRKALELPEVYIGANDWVSLPYNRVASVAMTTYTDRFIKHDEERFKEYLEKVRSGKATIAAGALLPHRIIASLDDENGGEEVAELQWKRMVDDLAKIGKLSNCLAICDVSGSMTGIPMEVSVALGVLVSELSEEPWKGKLITFSAEPKLQIVKGESLKEKTEFVRRMEWGCNTDFQKVFDVILQVAVNGKLKPEQMIKSLFVFSDMEFDRASQNPWETDYEAIVRKYREKGYGECVPEIVFWNLRETDYEVIVRKYREKGYGECVPEIVFWNLRDSMATPVAATQKGVALVSGFSKNLMKIFLEKGGIVDPVAVMEAAISGKEYEKLVVVD